MSRHYYTIHCSIVTHGKQGHIVNITGNSWYCKFKHGIIIRMIVDMWSTFVQNALRVLQNRCLTTHYHNVIELCYDADMAYNNALQKALIKLVTATILVIIPWPQNKFTSSRFYQLCCPLIQIRDAGKLHLNMKSSQIFVKEESMFFHTIYGTVLYWSVPFTWVFCKFYIGKYIQDIGPKTKDSMPSQAKLEWINLVRRHHVSAEITFC